MRCCTPQVTTAYESTGCVCSETPHLNALHLDVLEGDGEYHAEDLADQVLAIISS